jgi:hypothetical protein
VIHPTRNVGSGTTAELATWLADQGKPLRTLAG